MIQRYSEVSDGKRYHAINRDPQGEWCKWEDVAYLVKTQEESAASANECISRAESYRNFIANCCMKYGMDVPEDASFNSMVMALIGAVKEAAGKPKRDIADRLRTSSETLLTANAPLAAHLCQEAADEIEYLREQRQQAEQCYNRLLEDSGGIMGRRH